MVFEHETIRTLLNSSINIILFLLDLSRIFRLYFNQGEKFAKPL